MTRTKSIGSRLYSRSNRGQAIVEGVAMLGVLVTVVTLLLLAIVNTYIVSSYNLRLQNAASNAARNIVAQKWWMGMERPEYNQADAVHDAWEALNTELATMGFAPIPEANFIPTFTENVMLREKAITLVRVDFDVTLGGGRGSLLPGGVPLHVSAVASDAEHAVTTHGRALILAGPAGAQTGIRVPVYNATVGRQTPANPVLLNAGVTAGESPTAHLVLYCNSAGSKIQKFKDIGPYQTVPTSAQFGWGPNR